MPAAPSTMKASNVHSQQVFWVAVKELLHEVTITWANNTYKLGFPIKVTLLKFLDSIPAAHCEDVLGLGSGPALSSTLGIFPRSRVKLRPLPLNLQNLLPPILKICYILNAGLYRGPSRGLLQALFRVILGVYADNSL